MLVVKDRVPTIETLFRLAQQLALCKINKLVLEFEATFDCSSFGEVLSATFHIGATFHVVIFTLCISLLTAPLHLHL